MQIRHYTIGELIGQGGMGRVFKTTDTRLKLKSLFSKNPARPSVVVGRESEQETRLDTSGPRIRCPLCGWSPGKNQSWFCTCTHCWNTFDTGGVCPACLKQWTLTQCGACSRWSPHSDWYSR